MKDESANSRTEIKVMVNFFQFLKKKIDWISVSGTRARFGSSTQIVDKSLLPDVKIPGGEKYS